MLGLNVLAQSNSGGALGAILLLMIIVIVLAWALLLLVSLGKLFTKAGHPGWAAFVPIYNMIILLQIIERPGWWLILFFVPMVNFVVMFIVGIELAQAFGKDILYGLGLFVLTPIFTSMLAFGDSRYQGPQPLF